jgi:hypothetical protein
MFALISLRLSKRKVSHQFFYVIYRLVFMRIYYLILIFVIVGLLNVANLQAQELSLTGKVETQVGCAEKVMVWLSLDREDFQEKLLLLHTQVPVGGTYQFFLKPGKYLLAASDEVGCEFSKKIEIPVSSNNSVHRGAIKMVKHEE